MFHISIVSCHLVKSFIFRSKVQNVEPLRNHCLHRDVITLCKRGNSDPGNPTFSPRPHDRKTESQTQLAASLTQKLPEQHQQCWCFESETAVTGHQYHTSNDHVTMSTERSSTLRGLLSLFSSKHGQLLYIAICI